FVNKGQTVLLPLIGKDVTLGIVVNDKLCGSAAILRSGKVTMLGKTILGDVYKVMESTLDAGDQITMKGQESLSYGFVLLDERPALTASYRTIGKYALLSHTGFNSYRMSASWLDLLMKNTFVTALYTILGAIYSIYKLFSKKEKTLYE
ncbi:MAG: hypothetical protein HQK92_16395, partial [Nitrospirae bacterium]|nr:hypothetical protein [Nitrospirota bacterium]